MLRERGRGRYSQRTPTFLPTVQPSAACATLTHRACAHTAVGEGGQEMATAGRRLGPRAPTSVPSSLLLREWEEDGQSGLLGHYEALEINHSL